MPADSIPARTTRTKLPFYGKDLIRDYLVKSGMDTAQADALSRILDEMATRTELRAVEQRLERSIEAVRTEIANVEARLTWRFIAVTTFLASALTILNLFVS